MGFRAACTAITVVVDDDTQWTNGILRKLVLPLLSSPRIGCVFPDLRLRTSSISPSIWERLALLRHATAGVNLHASHAIDGGLYCHHGPTSAYRASILQGEALMSGLSGKTLVGGASQQWR